MYKSIFACEQDIWKRKETLISFKNIYTQTSLFWTLFSSGLCAYCVIWYGTDQGYYNDENFSSNFHNHTILDGCL